MRIAVDGRFCVGEYRGMGRFARNLISPIESQCMIFGTSGQVDNELNIIDSGPSFYPYWEQVHLPYLCSKYSVDILICPYNTAPMFKPEGTKIVLVLHDLIFTKSFYELPPSSQIYQVLGRIYRRFVSKRIVHKSDHIVTVSGHSKRQIILNFGVGEGAISVIPNTIDKEWFRGSQEEFDCRRPYIFMISGNAPSKNLHRGIRAFSHLISSYTDVDCDLLIAGVSERDHDYFYGIAEEEKIDKRVHFFSYLTDEKLRSVYAGAQVFFLPSLYEGFGIPLVEAMASQVPVVCSDKSCLPDIVGNAAILVDPLSPGEMAEGLHRALTDCDRREELIDRGTRRAREFHPDVVNERISSFWAEVGVSE